MSQAEKKKSKRTILYELLYKWLIEENCDNCQHMLTYRIYRCNDSRHPCNRCEFYDRFKIRVGLKADLQDKVTEIIKVMK